MILLVKSKGIYYHGCFLGNFLEFFRTTILLNIPGRLFFWSVKVSWQNDSIYFFFGHFKVFWVLFTLVRVILGLLAIYVEQSLWWGLQTCLFFWLYWKNISLFCGELLLRQLCIQSINKFLEKLWVKLTWYKVFLCNIIKLELEIKTT